MEETLEGGRGPPRAVAPVERESESEVHVVYMNTRLSATAVVTDHLKKGCSKLTEK
jgi:hypothetical protein